MAIKRVRSGRQPPRDGATGSANGGTLVGPLPERLQQEFQDLFGLGVYETRLLLALLRVGSAATRQLADLTGVPRTAMYQVLETLHVKGLAERIPTAGPAVWAPTDRDEVFGRLDAQRREALEDQLREYTARSVEVRQLLLEAFPKATAAVVRPHVHILHNASQVRQAYDRMVAEARTELVMFTRPPYASRRGYVNPAVLAMLARGVRTRVLYQEGDEDDPAFVTYAQHSVEARVAPELPIKLAVVDRSTALVVLTDPTEARYPITVLLEHPGYAALHAVAFEECWRIARAYVPAKQPQASATG